MKRSENPCSSCSTRIISFFSMTSTVVGATAVAVATQVGLPERQLSPKKSPGPRIDTTASFPDSLTTVSFTPPFLKVHDVLRGLTLYKQDLLFLKAPYLSPQTDRVQKCLRIEHTNYGLLFCREPIGTQGYTSA